MPSWIEPTIYFLGYACTWRPVVWAAITDFDSSANNLDGEDVLFGVLFGSMINIFWPAIVIGFIVRKFYQIHNESAVQFLMPRNVRKANELKEREIRIKAMERELNIK